MDKPLLILIGFTLLSIAIIEIFLTWYKSFLIKRSVKENFIFLLYRLTFAVLAFIFWRSFTNPEGLDNFISTHFYFALFVFCCYKFFISFFELKKKNNPS